MLKVSEFSFYNDKDKDEEETDENNWSILNNSRMIFGP